MLGKIQIWWTCMWEDQKYQKSQSSRQPIRCKSTFKLDAGPHTKISARLTDYRGNQVKDTYEVMQCNRIGIHWYRALSKIGIRKNLKLSGSTTMQLLFIRVMTMTTPPFNPKAIKFPLPYQSHNRQLSSWKKMKNKFTWLYASLYQICFDILRSATILLPREKKKKKKS